MARRPLPRHRTTITSGSASNRGAMRPYRRSSQSGCWNAVAREFANSSRYSSDRKSNAFSTPISNTGTPPAARISHAVLAEQHIVAALVYTGRETARELTLKPTFAFSRGPTGTMPTASASCAAWASARFPTRSWSMRCSAVVQPGRADLLAERRTPWLSPGRTPKHHGPAVAEGDNEKFRGVRRVPAVGGPGQGVGAGGRLSGAHRHLHVSVSGRRRHRHPHTFPGAGTPGQAQ